MGSDISKLSSNNETDDAEEIKAWLEQWTKQYGSLKDINAICKLFTTENISVNNLTILSDKKIDELCDKIKIIGDGAITNSAIQDYRKSKNVQGSNSTSNNNNNVNRESKDNDHDTELKEDTNNFEFAFDFTEVNKITNGITDTTKSRPMVMTMFSKHKLDHSVVRLIYFSESTKKNNNNDNSEHKTDRPLLLIRVFSVDLIWQEYMTSNAKKPKKRNVLRIHGPISDIKDIYDYNIDQFAILDGNNNLSIKRLIKIAEETMNEFGDYKLIRNNCRDFSKKFMLNVIKQYNNMNEIKNKETKKTKTQEKSQKVTKSAKKTTESHKYQKYAKYNQATVNTYGNKKLPPGPERDRASKYGPTPGRIKTQSIWTSSTDKSSSTCSTLQTPTMSLHDDTHVHFSSSTDDTVPEITGDLIQNYIFEYFNDNYNYDKYIYSEQSIKDNNSDINIKDRKARKSIELHDDEISPPNSLSIASGGLSYTVNNSQSNKRSTLGLDSNNTNINNGDFISEESYNKQRYMEKNETRIEGKAISFYEVINKYPLPNPRNTVQDGILTIHQIIDISKNNVNSANTNTNCRKEHLGTKFVVLRRDGLLYCYDQHYNPNTDAFGMYLSKWEMRIDLKTNTIQRKNVKIPMKIIIPQINRNNNNNDIEEVRDNSYQVFRDLNNNSNINVNSHAFSVGQFEFEATTNEKMYEWKNKLFRYFKMQRPTLFRTYSVSKNKTSYTNVGNKNSTVNISDNNNKSVDYV